MAQTRKSASKAGEDPVKADAARVGHDAGTIRQALDELGIDRPYYTCRAAGCRLEFTLYGGDVAVWPPEPASKSKPSRRKS